MRLNKDEYILQKIPVPRTFTSTELKLFSFKNSSKNAEYTYNNHLVIDEYKIKMEQNHK